MKNPAASTGAGAGGIAMSLCTGRGYTCVVVTTKKNRGLRDSLINRTAGSTSTSVFFHAGNLLILPQLQL